MVTNTIFFSLFIFLVILFFYIYIMHQFKRSEDLEMYEMDYTNNAQLQEVCDVRQPILFLLYPLCPKLFDDLGHPSVLNKKYGSYDVQIKDVRDYFSGSKSKCDLGTVPLPLSQALALIEQDITAKFLSETNGPFLEETGLLGQIDTLLDPLLKPAFTIHTNNDLLMGAINTVTPFQYHTYYRRFFCVTSGKIRLKMTPWTSTKYMHPTKDYEHYEFRSPIHPTGPSPEYQHDYDRINFLEFEVEVGHAVHIPPYWWYSIEYIGSSKITMVHSISYMTIMNMVATCPDLALYWLQQQNITHKVGKSIHNNNNNSLPLEEKIEIADPGQINADQDNSDPLGETTKSIIPFANNIENTKELTVQDPNTTIADANIENAKQNLIQ